MGRRAEALIVFGVPIEEDYEFPWDTAGFEDDPEGWWIAQTGFKASFDPWDEKGDRKPGIADDDPRIRAYFDERDRWEESHPMPFELVQRGHSDRSSYAICVPRDNAVVEWDEVHFIDPEHDFVIDAEAAERLVEFLDTYGIEREHEPRWLLLAYYG